MTDHDGGVPGLVERLVAAGRRTLASMFGRHGGFDAPEEPYDGVREPWGRNPGGRSSGIAVPEPDALSEVRAVGVGVERRGRRP